MPDKMASLQTQITQETSDLLQALKRVTGNKSLQELITHFLQLEKAHNSQAFAAAQEIVNKNKKIKEMARNG